MKIAVCICTFRNPEGLRRLLDGISGQELKSIREDDISVVVIDNDPDASASGVLDRYAREGRFKLLAQHQPKRGLASARNTALDTPRVRESDAFVFVDDDEIPSVGWIEAFVVAFDSPQCSIAVGPVEPIFETRPPSWVVSGEFFRKRCTSSEESHLGYTSNCMIRTAILKRTGIRFDETLNHIGGEDVLFFSQLRQRGFNIKCLPDAIVGETISSSRASVSWLFRRWVRAGGTSALLRNHSRNRWASVIINLGGGLGRVIVGGVRTLIVVVIRRRKDISPVISSLATVCRGMGMVMAAFGRTYEEYGSSYRSKRK
jgi:glycosyltransferase involved in cell wall biosynthesis